MGGGIKIIEKNSGETGLQGQRVDLEREGTLRSRKHRKPGLVIIIVLICTLVYSGCDMHRFL